MVLLKAVNAEQGGWEAGLEPGTQVGQHAFYLVPRPVPLMLWCWFSVLEDIGSPLIREHLHSNSALLHIMEQWFMGRMAEGLVNGTRDMGCSSPCLVPSLIIGQCFIFPKKLGRSHVIQDVWGALEGSCCVLAGCYVFNWQLNYVHKTNYLEGAIWLFFPCERPDLCTYSKCHYQEKYSVFFTF